MTLECALVDLAASRGLSTAPALLQQAVTATCAPGAAPSPTPTACPARSCVEEMLRCVKAEGAEVMVARCGCAVRCALCTGGAHGVPVCIDLVAA